jgi:hypothetical protein
MIVPVVGIYSDVTVDVAVDVATCVGVRIAILESIGKG